MIKIDGVDFDERIVVPYDPRQKRLYKARDGASIYQKHRLRLGSGAEGRQSSGLFAEIAVRAALKECDCRVLISEPRVPDGFVLAHYPGYRERGHKSYTRMFEYFDSDQIEKFNKVADQRKKEGDQREIDRKKRKRLKTKAGPTRGGGDPDLFVVRGDGTCFFVEVKDKGDTVRMKQGVVFPLIRRMLECEVWLAAVGRLCAHPGLPAEDYLYALARTDPRASFPGVHSAQAATRLFKLVASGSRGGAAARTGRPPASPSLGPSPGRHSAVPVFVPTLDLRIVI